MSEHVQPDSIGFNASFLKDLNKPLLISASDYLREKLDLARTLEKFDAIGEDLIAQVSDQIVESGASPLFVSSQIEIGEIDSYRMKELVHGLERGCRKAGVEHFIQAAEHGVTAGIRISAAATGVLEFEDRLGSHRVKAGDVIVAMPSSGMHTTGYSLINEVIENFRLDLNSHYGLGKSLGDLLLTPTEIYSLDCLALIKAQPENIHAFSRTSTGGVAAHIEKVIPAGLVAIYDRSTWSLPEEMKFLADVAAISQSDVERNWNIGIGMSAIVDQSVGDLIVRSLAARGMKAWIAGKVEKAAELGAPRSYLASSYK